MMPIVPAVKGQSLTSRETEILREKVSGASSQAVANRFDLSKRTVDFHLANIYRKLDAANLMEAYQKAQRMGLLK